MKIDCQRKYCRRRCRWRAHTGTYTCYCVNCALFHFISCLIYLFGFTLLFAHNTCLAYLYFAVGAHILAYLYFTFGVHTHVVDSSIYFVSRFCWRTTHACCLIYILLFIFCFWRTHLGLLIFYF